MGKNPRRTVTFLDVRDPLDWIFLAGGLAIFAGMVLELFSSGNHPFNPFRAHPLALGRAAILSKGLGLFLLVPTGLTLQGARIFLRDKRAFRGLSLQLAGFLLLFTPLALMGFLYHRIGWFAEEEIPGHLATIEARLSQPELSPAQRARWSRNRARWIFLEEGKATEYQTPDGRTEVFQPDADDKELKRDFEQNERVRKDSVAALKGETLFRFLLFLGVLLVGWVSWHPGRGRQGEGNGSGPPSSP